MQSRRIPVKHHFAFYDLSCQSAVNGLHGFEISRINFPDTVARDDAACKYYINACKAPICSHPESIQDIPLAVGFRFFDRNLRPRQDHRLVQVHQHERERSR